MSSMELKRLYGEQVGDLCRIFGITFDDDGHPRLEGPPTAEMTGEAIELMEHRWDAISPVMDALARELESEGAALVWEGPNPGRVLRSLPLVALLADKMILADPLSTYACVPA